MTRDKTRTYSTFLEQDQDVTQQQPPPPQQQQDPPPNIQFGTSIDYQARQKRLRMLPASPSEALNPFNAPSINALENMFDRVLALAQRNQKAPLVTTTMSSVAWATTSATTATTAAASSLSSIPASIPIRTPLDYRIQQAANRGPTLTLVNGQHELKPQERDTIARHPLPSAHPLRPKENAHLPFQWGSSRLLASPSTAVPHSSVDSSNGSMTEAVNGRQYRFLHPPSILSTEDKTGLNKALDSKDKATIEFSGSEPTRTLPQTLDSTEWKHNDDPRSNAPETARIPNDKTPDAESDASVVELLSSDDDQEEEDDDEEGVLELDEDELEEDDHEDISDDDIEELDDDNGEDVEEEIDQETYKGLVNIFRPRRYLTEVDFESPDENNSVDEEEEEQAEEGEEEDDEVEYIEDNKDDPETPVGRRRVVGMTGTYLKKSHSLSPFGRTFGTLDSSEEEEEEEDVEEGEEDEVYEVADGSDSGKDDESDEVIDHSDDQGARDVNDPVLAIELVEDEEEQGEEAEDDDEVEGDEDEVEVEDEEEEEEGEVSVGDEDEQDREEQDREEQEALRRQRNLQNRLLHSSMSARAPLPSNGQHRFLPPSVDDIEEDEALEETDDGATAAIIATKASSDSQSKRLDQEDSILLIDSDEEAEEVEDTEEKSEVDGEDDVEEDDEEQDDEEEQEEDEDEEEEAEAEQEEEAVQSDVEDNDASPTSDPTAHERIDENDPNVEIDSTHDQVPLSEVIVSVEVAVSTKGPTLQDVLNNVQEVTTNELSTEQGQEDILPEPTEDRQESFQEWSLDAGDVSGENLLAEPSGLVEEDMTQDSEMDADNIVDVVSEDRTMELGETEESQGAMEVDLYPERTFDSKTLDSAPGHLPYPQPLLTPSLLNSTLQTMERDESKEDISSGNPDITQSERHINLLERFRAVAKEEGISYEATHATPGAHLGASFMNSSNQWQQPGGMDSLSAHGGPERMPYETAMDVGPSPFQSMPARVESEQDLALSTSMPRKTKITRTGTMQQTVRDGKAFLEHSDTRTRASRSSLSGNNSKSRTEESLGQEELVQEPMEEQTTTLDIPLTPVKRSMIELPTTMPVSSLPEEPLSPFESGFPTGLRRPSISGSTSSSPSRASPHRARQAGETKYRGEVRLLVEEARAFCSSHAGRTRSGSIPSGVDPGGAHSPVRIRALGEVAGATSMSPRRTSFGMSETGGSSVPGPWTGSSMSPSKANEGFNTTIPLEKEEEEEYPDLPLSDTFVSESTTTILGSHSSRVVDLAAERVFESTVVGSHALRPFIHPPSPAGSTSGSGSGSGHAHRLSLGGGQTGILASTVAHAGSGSLPASPLLATTFAGSNASDPFNPFSGVPMAPGYEVADGGSEYDGSRLEINGVPGLLGGGVPRDKVTSTLFMRTSPRKSLPRSLPLASPTKPSLVSSTTAVAASSSASASSSSSSLLTLQQPPSSPLSYKSRFQEDVTVVQMSEGATIMPTETMEEAHSDSTTSMTTAIIQGGGNSKDQDIKEEKQP